MKITLEYSPKQNAFHNNSGNHKPDTNNYHTICKSIDDVFADRFIRVIRKKTDYKPMKLSYVKNEFKKFCKD
jgi:plasmid replication initiation protein